MILFHCLNNISLTDFSRYGRSTRSSSEREAVLLHGYHEVWLQVALALLSHPVAVESGWLPAQQVGLVFEVVFLQVVQKPGRHVSVVRARSKCGEHHRTTQLLEPTSDQPARENYQGEVGKQEGNTLA